MPAPLTELEEHVYHYLIDFLAENTYQPSIREIARQFRIKSTKTVSDLLHALETKGYIERDEARSRGVRLLGMAAAGATQPVPYYGRVHAVQPAVRSEDRECFITVDRRFIPANDVFFLRATGAMTSRGILEGDYVMVSPSTQAADGAVVSARIGDRAALRTVAHRGAAVVLEPANAADASTEVGPTTDAAILGAVVGVFRPLFDRPVPGIPGLEHGLPAS